MKGGQSIITFRPLLQNQGQSQSLAKNTQLSIKLVFISISEGQVKT